MITGEGANEDNEMDTFSGVESSLFLCMFLGHAHVEDAKIICYIDRLKDLPK